MWIWRPRRPAGLIRSPGVAARWAAAVRDSPNQAATPQTARKDHCPKVGAKKIMGSMKASTHSHQLSMTVLMSPDMANFSGNVHGGHPRCRTRWRPARQPLFGLLHRDAECIQVMFLHPIGRTGDVSGQREPYRQLVDGSGGTRCGRGDPPAGGTPCEQLLFHHGGGG